MRIINKTKDTVLAKEAHLADTPFKRMKGLLGRKEFKSGDALILKPCQSVHTFFMPFAIDVIFMDQDNKIIKAISSFKPWRLSGIYLRAASCIELPVGAIPSSFSSLGDLLSLEP